MLDARFRSRGRPCEMCDGQSDTSILPISTISPLPHTLVYLNISFIRMTSGQSMRTFTKCLFFLSFDRQVLYCSLFAYV
jgi:hypothetical protein